MGYVSRTGDGDGDYFPRVVSLPHVADANARLSLDPTGKVAGYQVIQDDNSTTYTFNGDGADADAGLWVTGAGNAEYNGPYTFNSGGGGSDTYSQIAGLNTCHNNGLGTFPWLFNNDLRSYISTDIVDYAWQESAWTKGADVSLPVPTVTRNPIASEANWTNS